MIDLLTQACSQTYDMILISGGSGPGAYDFSAELFRHLGTVIHFREINVRPGKPLIFGITETQVVFGLPGNVLSHFVCFHLFVRHALEHLLGRSIRAVQAAHLSEAMPDTFNARETWWPAQVKLNEGRVEARALPWKSSGDITHLPAANALIRVRASTPTLAAGTIVELLITRHFS
jgi:molybdopterin molybdotransferase